jgi:uncharacterized protein (TIGR00725 family)
VAVVGSGEASATERERARAIGAALGRLGAVVVCGGLGGVMDAACAGARESGAMTVGILPGHDRREASPHVQVALATGLGEARNALLVRAVDAVIAVGGEFGTLSEVALALKAGVPVVGVDTWELARRGRPVEAIEPAATPEAAARRAVDLAAAAG